MHEDDLKVQQIPGNIWDFFHRACDMAVDSPDYDPAVLIGLESKILILQSELIKRLK